MKRVLALLLIPSLTWAQAADPAKVQPPADGIAEMEFDDFDLESLVAGEWSQEEFVSEEKQKDGSVKSTGLKTRRACVKADKEHVWIELSEWDLEANKAEIVHLCEVDRKSRKVLKAWRSEKGAKGKPAELDTTPLKAPETPDGKGAGGIVDEMRQVGKHQVRCSGLSLQKIKGTQAGMQPAPKLLFVFSKEPPFRRRLDDADVAARHLLHEKRGPGVLAGNLALVEVSVDNPEGVKQSRKLADFGTDAKATVKK